ncbi:MAG: hypothetical protein H6719_19165 [Sandaracinaceae bacterium]|nr:hypothetical protein [Sandaracinaceae bacterium]
MLRSSVTALFGLCLGACVSAGGGDAVVTTTPPAASEPSILGFALGSAPEPARADLAFTTDGASRVATGAVARDGHDYRTSLTFYEDRLARVSASATGLTLADFEALAARLEAELGPGERTVCASEVGPPLERYLASGRGGVRVEWASERVRASAALSPISGGALQVFVFAELTPLADRYREDLDLKGGPKQAASSCAEMATAPPTAAGFRFGDSADAVRRLLGTDAPIEGFQTTTPHRMAGVDGELVVRFHDDCLAIVMFIAPGTLAGYRALQGALLTELGEPDRREQCSPTGAAPTAEELAARRGSLQTLWTTPALRAAVRWTPGVGDEAPRIVLEVSATGLEERAPSIDF